MKGNAVRLSRQEGGVRWQTSPFWEVQSVKPHLYMCYPALRTGRNSARNQRYPRTRVLEAQASQDPAGRDQAA